MLADLRFLHVPSSDTDALPAFVLTAGTDKYLFNVGEGTTRSASQRKLPLTRVAHTFIPRVGWEAIGGLPGALMTMSDCKRDRETVHGPLGLRYALATMRSYAKRDTMKLTINEINNTSGIILKDHNLTIQAVTLNPLQPVSRSQKKARLEPESPQSVSAASTQLQELWRQPGFDPSSLQGADAIAWIEMVSDCMFNDQNRQRDTEDVQSVDADARKQVVKPGSNRSPGGLAPRKGPLTPAFLDKVLPAPPYVNKEQTRTSSSSQEDGQAPVLAFICEAHSQRGKFDVAKAAELGVRRGKVYSMLTSGRNVTILRPKTWHTMTSSEKEEWLQPKQYVHFKSRKSRKSQKNSIDSKSGESSGAGAAQKEEQQPNIQLEEVSIKSSELLGVSKAGFVMFQIYLPSVDYIEDLVSGEAAIATFAPYTQQNNTGRTIEKNRTPRAIVHVAPTEVFRDSRYQAWMQQFGPDCNHILANRDVCANKLMFPSNATIQLRLSRLDPVMFQVPQYQLQPFIGNLNNLFEKSPDSGLKLIAARADLSVSLNPRDEPKQIESDTPDFDWSIPSKEAEQLASFAGGSSEAENTTGNTGNAKLKHKEELRKAWQQFALLADKFRSTLTPPKTHPKDDVLITTLGTGSAAPSKYRNVISTLIQTPRSGNILLDAGESTYGQLRRKFGCRRDNNHERSSSLKDEDVDSILTNLRMIFISHNHADHHIGLTRLLLERRKLTPRSMPPLYLVVPGHVRRYLREYESVQSLGLLEDVHVLYNQDLDWRHGIDPLQVRADERWLAYKEKAWQAQRLMKGLKESTGLQYVHTARVIHSGQHCHGLVLRHSDGWSITYSGDTRPAPELVAAGQNSSLLIHEATLEDSQRTMAIAKGHSTFTEAIFVGQHMKAQNILLTHFSQRYPKVATSTSSFDASEGAAPVALAFDMVTYPLSQFARIQRYTPAIQTLFSSVADAEGDDDVNLLAADGDAAGADKLDGDLSQDFAHRDVDVTALANQDRDAIRTMETDSTIATVDAPASVDVKPPSQMRKAFKPEEWRYLSISLTRAFTAQEVIQGAVFEPRQSEVAELVRSAQMSSMGTVGGSHSFDVLSLSPHVEKTKTTWHAVVRTAPSHAPDLAAALALLPTAAMSVSIGSNAVNLPIALRVLGPATSIQTLQSLFT